MLNMDYKILAKVLATHMKTVLPYLISNNQNGFMEGRQISHTIITYLDISKYNKNVSGYILFLDFEKCFDRIEYSAIHGSLDYFGFGENFKKWTNLLLCNFQSCTSNNGFFSEYLDVSRSCHQGCPASPYYFLLCGEVLSIEIWKSDQIKGITINDLELIIAQFADDSQLFLDSQKSLEEAIKLLSCIEANTSLKVNYEKSCIMPVGNVCKISCSKNIPWDPGGVFVLGVDVTLDHTEQFERLLGKAKQVLELWHHRQLSLMGKVVVINTLIASLFVYLLQSVNIPNNFVNKFNELILAFLWQGKCPKIPLEFLQGEKEARGLKLVNMELKDISLKTRWILSENEFCKSQLDLAVPECIGTYF